MLTIEDFPPPPRLDDDQTMILGDLLACAADDPGFLSRCRVFRGPFFERWIHIVAASYNVSIRDAEAAIFEFLRQTSMD